jgi:hypothetical protein
MFANITNPIVEYKFPRIKIDWLAAGVLLIPSSVELVNDRYAGVEFANFFIQWKARAAVLTNKKEENFDQILHRNPSVKEWGSH